MLKYNIFLIIVAVAFFCIVDGYYSPFYKALNIENKSSSNDVSKIFSMKGYIVIVEKEKYIERGHATFKTIKIKNVDTECGVVDVLPSFFNDELVSIKYANFSNKRYDSNICLKKIMKRNNINGSNVSKEIFIREDRVHYDIMFSDDIIDIKIIKWADKWS